MAEYGTKCRPAGYWLYNAYGSKQPALAFRQALKLFFDYVFHYRNLKSLLRYNPLVLSQLRFKFLHPLKLVELQARVFAFPLVECCLADAVLSTDIGYALARLLLL